MGTWIALDGRRRTFAIAAAAVALISVLYALNIRTVFFGQHAVTAIDDIGEAVAAALASIACVWAARRARGKDRLGWALMAISAGLWSAGEVVWSIYEVGMGVQVPYPSLADAGFLAAVPFAIAGIRAFWGDARGTSARWRIWFDGIIVAIALTATAWGFGLRAVWDSNSTTKLLDLAYPVGDILIGTVLILAIRRATHQQKGRMALLLAGVAAYSIADSAFSYLTAQGAFGSVGSVLDTGWFAGFLLIALAATYPDTPPKTASQQAPLDLWQLALLLTVNMILERKEFLEMLTDIETTRSTLNREFKTALVGIRQMSDQVIEADRAYDEDVRLLAADIHGQADRLDHILERML